MKGWVPIRLLRATGTGSKHPMLTLSSDIAEAIDLVSGESCVIRAGLANCRVHIMVDESINPKSVIGNTAFFERIMLPSGIPLGLRASAVGEESQELRLGPIVGILADARRDGGLFGEQKDFLTALINAASRRGYLAFVLTPDGAMGSGNVVGFRPSSSGFKRSRLPFPDVVYDRCLRMTYSQVTQLSKAKRNLASKGVIQFNCSLGNKMKMHKYLSNVPEIKPFMPETKIAGLKAITEMLRRHSTVYVKPAMGTQGRGIARLSKIKGAGYRASLVKGDSTREVRASSVSRLIGKISMSHNRTYVVQQGIDLIKLGTRLVDLRVLIQRGEDGQWVITGAAARIGKSGSPVSNLHQGGGAITYQKVIAKVFGCGTAKYKSATQQVRQLATDVAKALDKGFGPLGELGVDIGVDRNGRVWYIEANPRPGRRVFKLIGDPVLINRSISRPMEFAAYLATKKLSPVDGDSDDGKEQQDVEERLGESGEQFDY